MIQKADFWPLQKPVSRAGLRSSCCWNTDEAWKVRWLGWREVFYKPREDVFINLIYVKSTFVREEETLTKDMK